MQTTRSEPPRTARSAEPSTPSVSNDTTSRRVATVAPSASVEDGLSRPRTVGTPMHWAAQGAVFGGVVGWLAPPYLLLAMAIVANTEGVLPIRSTEFPWGRRG